MAVDNLLSQAEIDALLHGVVGELEFETATQFEQEPVRDYDFSSEDYIVRGKVPSLEAVNGRFSSLFRSTLSGMLRRTASISVAGVELMKYVEYAHTLFPPTSLNMVTATPLNGTMLIAFDPKLVFSVVDSYFGGHGCSNRKSRTGEFTPVEQRVIENLLSTVLGDLKKAWDPLMNVDFEFVDSVPDPQYTGVLSPAEVVVTSRFHIELDGSIGELHVTMPYAMLEPLRDLPDSTQGEGTEIDQRWSLALKQQLEKAEVDLCAVLAETQRSLRDVLRLKVGDIIPIDGAESVLLMSETVPIFRAKVGVSNDNMAVKIVKRMNGGSK